MPADTRAAGTLAPETVAPETVAPETLAAETVAPETAAAQPTLWDQPVAGPAKTALSFPSRVPDDTVRTPPAQSPAVPPGGRPLPQAPPQPPAEPPPPAWSAFAAPPADDPWLAANTQSLLLPPSPAGAPWVPPPPAPPVAVPPAGPPAWPPQAQPGRGRKTALIVVATVVVVLAAGGGGFALVSSMKAHPTAGATSHPTVRASRPGTTAPATPSATPTASQAPTPTPSPSPTSPGTVSVAPGVSANPAAPQVTAYLNSYFHAINTHNYQEYTSLLDAQMQANDTPSSFASGYATTTDSAETLTAISGTGGGGVAATVSFTSHQSAADSIDDSTCTDWTITLYLEPQGSSYVDTPPPSSYRSTYTAC